MTDLLPPRENPDPRGHEEAEKILLDAFLGGRLAHAWLISGPRGIGKATLAYRFARYILAKGGEGAGGLFGDALSADDMYLAPDNPVFMRTASGGHADLKAIERTVNEKTGKLSTEIIVKDVRSIGNFMSLTSAEGGWRVVVIDSADDMNRHAANAVLKVLEEPPARALLVLVSHNPGRLLATIRSRCRKLALQPLPGETVEKLIAEALPDLDAGDASSLAYLADGSPGRALALAAEGGLELYRDMTGLLETLPRLDIPALHAFGARLGKAGAEEAFSTASNLLRWWLARLILSASGAMAADGLSADEKALMGRLGQAAGLDRWFEVWEKINRLLDKTEHANLDRKQVVLNVFLTLENAVSR